MSVRVVKLNGIEVSTYGLRLQKYSGDLDMSAKKKSTSVFNEAADVFFEDRKITFEFYGKYNTPEALGNAVVLFNANLTSVIEGTMYVYGTSIDDPGLLWRGRFVNGSRTIIQYDNALFITVVMTWQGKSFS